MIPSNWQAVEVTVADAVYGLVLVAVIAVVNLAPVFFISEVGAS